jgi:hypothetical protein
MAGEDGLELNRPIFVGLLEAATEGGIKVGITAIAVTISLNAGVDALFVM